MPAISVEIVRFIDEHQPGFVECVLRDAANNEHTFVEKVPIVTAENLWATSSYPRRGLIECVIQEQWADQSGRSLVRVTTEQPWHTESTLGETSFVVLDSQVVHGERTAEVVSKA